MKKNLDWEKWEEEKRRLGKMRRGKTFIGVKWEEEKPRLEKMRKLILGKMKERINQNKHSFPFCVKNALEFSLIATFNKNYQASRSGACVIRPPPEEVCTKRHKYFIYPRIKNKNRHCIHPGNKNKSDIRSHQPPPAT